MDAFSCSLAAAALVDGQHFSLPGFGTIEGIYIPAWINHVSREVDPPRLDVRWTQPPHASAQTFAELLVSTGATSAEAHEIEGEWLRELSRGRAIAIGDLGTLRLSDGGGLVDWTPSERALASAYWSGGAVAVEPLPKRAAAREASSGDAGDVEPRGVAIASVEPTVVSTDEDRPTRVKRVLSLARILRYAAMFAVVSIGLALLRSAFSEQISETESAQAIAVSQDRLNRSPLDPAPPTAGVLDEGFEAPLYNPAFGPSGAIAAAPPRQVEQVIRSAEGPSVADGPGAPAPTQRATPTSPSKSAPARLAREQQVDPADLASRRPTSTRKPVAAQSTSKKRPREKEEVIILGSFGSNQNAARLTERLAEKGLLPYVDQPGNLTRVGVSFTASSQAEVDAMLTRMRREFNSNAWVLE